jgi:hypothetical protein
MLFSLRAAEFAAETLSYAYTELVCEFMKYEELIQIEVAGAS